jgi:ADP-heptose:LPS heptosyltransferase
MKILVVQLRQLGDILLTTPVLREIKRNIPGSSITFLSHNMGRLILDDCPFIDDYFTYGSDWTIRQEISLAATLRARKFDYAFDFMNNPRSALYTLGSLARERVAFRSARWWCYNNWVQRKGPEQYIVRDKFRILEAAGIRTNPQNADQLVLPWFEKETGPVMRFVGQHPWASDAPLRVALSPTHRREARRWPLDRYAALADFLARNWGAFVVWVWGPGEEGDIDAVMGMCKETTYKAPKTSFRELAALIANTDLFIGNSNGPSHVAVATGTPSLQLHGPTRASAWCPQNARHHAIQAASMDDVALSSVINELESMRPMLAAYADNRKSAGMRVNWVQPPPALNR